MNSGRWGPTSRGALRDHVGDRLIGHLAMATFPPVTMLGDVFNAEFSYDQAYSAHRAPPQYVKFHPSDSGLGLDHVFWKREGLLSPPPLDSTEQMNQMQSDLRRV